MQFPKDMHLFCRVVDNFGDIGVCWRLARQLAEDQEVRVTLWVDDLAAFQKICRAIDPLRDVQQVLNVLVRRWPASFGAIAPSGIPDLVIEGFACELPQPYLLAMAARPIKPVWINLEYLSAESWVEDCHAMASRHPSLPLTKHFFFPGFSKRTGGLPIEKGLAERRIAFQQNVEEIHTFLSSLGVNFPRSVRKVSLFCYPGAPVDALFAAMQQAREQTICLVPEGVVAHAVEAFLKRPARAGAAATHGALTLHVLPFVDQPDYDKLLWACDLNFVRGEDSFVRAQWAARPFVWHIYPQEEQAHWKKLEAFLARYERGISNDMAKATTGMWHAWNGEGVLGSHWHLFDAALPALSQHAKAWSQQLSENGNLASNLIQFVRKVS